MVLLRPANKSFQAFIPSYVKLVDFKVKHVLTIFGSKRWQKPQYKYLQKIDYYISLCLICPNHLNLSSYFTCSKPVILWVPGLQYVIHTLMLFWKVLEATYHLLNYGTNINTSEHALSASFSPLWLIPSSNSSKKIKITCFYYIIQIINIK